MDQSGTSWWQRQFGSSSGQPRTESPFAVPDQHVVLGSSVQGPWPPGSARVTFAMGCFWGVERLFWQVPGVVSTAAGYIGGQTAFPTYREVCSGTTGHAEAAQVVFDPTAVRFVELLAIFWENHDPTTVDRQGNDVGSQYRSAIFTTTAAQYEAAVASQRRFDEVLAGAGSAPSVTQVVDAGDVPFYYAEADHQQYLHKVPSGYCNHGPNGLVCPVPDRNDTEGPTR